MKKPNISKVNKTKRLHFTNFHINEPHTFWESVLFSDKSKFNVFSSERRFKVWRRPNEAFKSQNLCPTVKHGRGSVLVWGYMSVAGVGNLVFIDGNMDQHIYLNILKNNLEERVHKFELTGLFIFQQNNDPNHTAKCVKEFLILKIANQLFGTLGFKSY